MEAEVSFGAWVTQRRKALDLTRKQLAQRVGYSISALRKIEGDERRPSRQVAELLADCLQVPPDQRATFVRAARGVERVERLGVPLPVSASAWPKPTPPRLFSNLPTPPTPLIGREHELVALARLLRDPQCRLLTIVGPGGIGKTRLAIEAASAQGEAFSDGVFFASLVGTSSTGSMVPAIAKAVGFSFSGPAGLRTQLVNYLRGKQMLLLLDNLEHLLDDAELLAQVLECAPGPVLLVTSRERLDLRGEWVFEVQGLPVPAHDQVEGLESYSAVELFMQSARRAWLGFELSGEERPNLVRICQLVEGMPLGIELAAAWVRVLSCREIAQEIERNLDFLSASARDVPERHRSIRAVFDQSWHLLSAEGQQVLRRLSVFRGGFGREAAERVAGATLTLLSAMVAKSLVRRSSVGRYDLHELIRQYARERLVVSGEFESVCRQHMCFFLEFAEEVEPKLRGAEQLAWLDRLETDHDNLRVALEWSSRPTGMEDEMALGASHQSAQMSLRLVGALFFFWKRRDHWSEGREWIRRALARSADLPGTRERAKALNAAVLLASEQTDTNSARRFAEENLALAQVLGDPHSIACALDSFGFLLWKQKEYAAAASYCKEGLALFRQLGDRFAVADSLHHLGHIAINQDDYEAAQPYYDESATIYREVKDQIGLDDVLGDLGLLAYLRNDYTRARAYLEQSLARFRKAASTPGIEAALNRLGDLARCRGDYDQAERLYSESLDLYYDMGDKDEIPSLLHNLGYVAQHRGDYAQSMALFEQALVIQQEMGNQAGIAECLAGIAGVLAAQGKAQQSARLFGAVEVSREAVGAGVWPANRIEYERNVTLLRQLLDDETLTAAWAEGRAMTIEQAIASAELSPSETRCHQPAATGDSSQSKASASSGSD